MACTIESEYTLEQGRKDWYMVTGDFGSLQMRLTTQDTYLNDGHVLDPNLYELYSKDSICPDAHSMTGLNTFCKSVGYKVIDVEMDDGSIQKIPQDIKVNIIRNGKEISIDAKNLHEGDEFISIDEES